MLVDTTAQISGAVSESSPLLALLLWSKACLAAIIIFKEQASIPCHKAECTKV